MSNAFRRDQGPRGGAEHLARIHGTEEDKVNCPFYFKIGACRHGDRCSRQHHRPPFSQTVLVQHMWQVYFVSRVSRRWYAYVLLSSPKNPYSTVAAMGVDPAQLNEQKIQEDVSVLFQVDSKILWQILIFSSMSFMKKSLKNWEDLVNWKMFKFVKI